MADLIAAIAQVRLSVGSIFKVHPTGNMNAAGNPVFQFGFVGSAFCIVPNTTFLTANHVFNEGKPRDASDRYSLFVCQDNGPKAWRFSMTNFQLEDAAADMAIFDAAIAPGHTISVPSLPIALTKRVDGTRVLTYGFPAPLTHTAVLDLDGNWVAGTTRLIGHANEGIVAGSVAFAGVAFPEYEFNVGWHNGESGGPVCTLDPVAALAVMQANRTIQMSPTTTARGPRIGRALGWIESHLRTAGATLL